MNRYFQILALMCVAFLAGPAGAEEPAEIVVSAGASLKDAFKEIAGEFGKENPGAKVRFNFSSSGVLVNQIEQGAPVTVFASPSPEDVARLGKGGFIQQEAVFAHNTMVLLVGNQARDRIKGMADLATEPVRLVMSAKHVPAARYAREVLRKADESNLYGPDYSKRVLAKTISEEMDVRMTAMKVAVGEGDAAFAYYSDITGDIRQRVQAVPIPEAINSRVNFSMAVLKNAPQAALGQKFYDFVLSERAQAILERHGFQSRRSLTSAPVASSAAGEAGR
ncbi:MAG TPA: molybdate ABC transporter substrate-binding protein [Burkholderiaceae bacterium]|nr:molybdate ABC transporter substrate-binding protein [Burkholderiaceae bacterium]